MKLLIIQGPNLNLIGAREVDKYGIESFDEINKELHAYSFKKDIELEIFQSNFEGEIVEKIQTSMGDADGIIINPAAYTHTSVAIRDAILAVDIPTVEVHLSNIYSREEFRHHSYVAPVCIGQICGFKATGYKLAIDALIEHLKN